MRALCEIYRELDHDAEIHPADIAANGKLTVPVLASGGGAQTLAANYAPMCEEVALDVTGHLVPDAGHWVPRRTLTISVACSSSSTARPEPHIGVRNAAVSSGPAEQRSSRGCVACLHLAAAVCRTALAVRARAVANRQLRGSTALFR